jgi:hypothetical protein
MTDREKVEIGYDWTNYRGDEIVLALRHGCVVHFVHEPFASWLHERLTTHKPVMSVDEAI